AQGGIASVWRPEDSLEAHIADTLAAGDGLCHRDTVEVVVREGPDRVRDLIALGTNFDLRGDPDDHEYDLGREGGHSKRRILHATDATGREVIRALGEAVRATPNITIYESHLAVDLLLSRGERPVCWGAYVLDRATREVHRFPARATFLCTGGAGKVYLYTSNPDVATGDGVAMANGAGAIDNEMKVHGFACVYLDISHRDAEFVRRRFPTVYETCRRFGIDMTRQPIPVVPAAHYACGGVLADLEGATALERLYACG